MASAASTMPGRVATFCTCSSERSLSIAARSSRSAKIRAGTRMSARALAGISQTISSTWTRSDIEHQPREPAFSVLPQLETVVGDRLDEVRGLVGPSRDRRAQILLAELECRYPFGHEVVRLGEEDELAEPVGEECRGVGSSHGHAVLGRLPTRVAADELRERRERFCEDRLLRRCGDLELQFGGVIDPVEHDVEGIRN